MITVLKSEVKKLYQLLENNPGAGDFLTILQHNQNGVGTTTIVYLSDSDFTDAIDITDYDFW